MNPQDTMADDNSVTITEALKRLASQNRKPARQSFDAAVKSGKILKAPDRSDGKIRVFWNSVQEYVTSGGFKPRRSSKVMLMSADPDALNPCVGSASEAPCQATPVPEVLEEPAKNVPQEEGGDKHGTSADHYTSHAQDKRRSTRDRRAEHAGREAVDKGVGRRGPRMRTLKNSLRRLNFEEMKAIRDWADNRLLTVLHPTPSAAGGHAGSDKPQHA